jgi:hypothetical protein
LVPDLTGGLQERLEQDGPVRQRQPGRVGEASWERDTSKWSDGSNVLAVRVSDIPAGKRLMRDSPVKTRSKAKRPRHRGDGCDAAPRAAGVVDERELDYAPW